LICGRASRDGEVSISNAGHPPALFSRGGQIQPIFATGLPLGMFPNQKFSVERLKLESGDALLLYTDGVPDALNTAGDDYGISMLMDLTMTSRSLPPETLVAKCLADVSTFRQGGVPLDDTTIMGVRRQ